MLGSFRSNVTVGIAVLVGIAGLSYVLAASAAPPGGTTAAVEFTADGKLKQPVGYRKWVYVGEVVTPNDLNDGEATFPEFHSVYMDPESFAEYEKTGKFRDGTVLIKELSSVGSKKAPSGNGYFQGEFTGLEATIKDSKRFKDEPGNVGLLQLRPQVSAQGGGGEERRQPRATSATRTTPRRTGSSASTTPSCVQRPRVPSKAGRGCLGWSRPGHAHIPDPEETTP